MVEAAWRAGDASAAQLAGQLPANHEPADQPTHAAPRLIELCFQTAGLWEAGREGRLALPSHVGRAVVRRDAGEQADGPLVATARPTADGFDCVVTAPDGTVLVRLQDYRTIALPQALADDVQAPLAAVMAD